MVLSNKKLKHKLRAAAAERAQSSDLDSNQNPDPNSELQELLEAAKQRHRLLKKEKRRKAQALKAEEDGKVKEEEEEEEENKKKRRKRKREEGGSEEKGLEAKKAKKAKKKKMKKKKQKKDKEKKRVKSEDVGELVTEAVKEGTADSQMEGDEDIATKIYVGGIPYYSMEDDIRSFFDGCGTITEVDCMTFPDSGKFRGIAIISFKTEAAAKRALALDGADMGGFYLKIQPYKITQAKKVPNFAPQMVEGYNRIYAGNLSWNITEDDLRKFFSDCKISSIRFGMDKETGEFRGYAHVDFSDDVSLTKALKLDQQIVCGRPIKVSCAVPKKEAKVDSAAVPTVTSDVVADSVLTATNNVVDDTGLASISGKIKRRKCYECGEKGHLSSACPNKQTADTTNSNAS